MNATEKGGGGLQKKRLKGKEQLSTLASLVDGHEVPLSFLSPHIYFEKVYGIVPWRQLPIYWGELG